MRLLVLVLVLVLAAAARAEFKSDFPVGVERSWIGPEYWANRLADWRLRDGRLECVESRAQFPLRTVHLLTRSIQHDDEAFDVAVRMGPVDPESSDGWAGVLIGAGGPHVDPRLTAQVHRVIAEGDLVAVHGRYTGFGPKPLVAVDIYRVEDGRIAEHWDILQEEVTQTASGNPMFTPTR